MGRLEDLIGAETDLARLSGVIQEHARTWGVAVVGAYHVTCSDEAEWECVESFQQCFAASLLPALKLGRRAVFRSINLGARYETGAIHVAEQHFAAGESSAGWKLMVAKINAHVGVRETQGGPEYGRLDRYHRSSACCGALAALMAGVDLPAVWELADAFASGGKDRLAVILDTSILPERHRALVAAITSAALQARRATDDIESRAPATPTRFLVLPCVTINRPRPDTEILVGRYEIDWTAQAPQTHYEGLGDDPASYRIEHRQGRLSVTPDSPTRAAGRH
jgi:hypothetical protein